MSHSIRENYPTPIALRYHAMHQDLKSLRPNYQRALGYLLDVVEIYLQFVSYVSILSFLRAKIQPDQSIREGYKALIGTALSTGHWLSLWKTFAGKFDKDRPSLFIPALYSLLYNDRGDEAGWIKEIDQWPNMRNRLRGHSFTLDEPVARSHVESLRPSLERMLEASQFLEDFALVRITDCVSEGSSNLLEVCWLKGLHPEDEPVTVSSPLRFATDRVYLLPRNSLILGVCEHEHEVLSLEPFVVPPHSGTSAEVAFFQGCKNKKLLFLDTGLTAKDRWEDGTRRTTLEELIGTKTTPVAPESYTPAWALELRSLEIIDHRQYLGRKSNANAFYRGNQVSWADLAHNHDIRRLLYQSNIRVTYEDFLGRICRERIGQARSLESPPLVLFGGHGGSGKTTVLLRTAFEISKNFPDALVLRLILGAQPDLSELERAYKESGNKTLCLLIDDAQNYVACLGPLFREARIRNLPLCCFAAERLNQWVAPSLRPDIYELRVLADEEIADLLDHLERANCLGTLTNKTSEDRLAVFKAFADKQILVGLREATEGKQFDDIIEDEYLNIPDESAQTIYRHACISEVLGGHLPLAVAMRLGNCGSHGNLKKMLTRCQGVLVKRHAREWESILSPRHLVIAEIVVRRVYTRNGENELDHDSFLEDFTDLLDCLSAEKDPQFEQTLRTLARRLLTNSQFGLHAFPSTNILRFTKAICRFERPFKYTSGIFPKGTSIYRYSFLFGVLGCWLKQGHPNAAIAVLEEAIELQANPQRKSRWTIELAELLAVRGSKEDTDRAIEILQSAKAMADEEDRTMGIVLIRLAKLLEHRKSEGDIDLAIEILEQAILDPELRDMTGYLTLSLSSHLEHRCKSDDLNKAVKFLLFAKQRVDTNSGLVEVLLRLAKILEKRCQPQDIELAISVLEEGLQKNLQDRARGNLALRLATFLEKRGSEADLQQAIKLLETTRIQVNDVQLRRAILMRLTRLITDRGTGADIEHAIHLLQESSRSPELQEVFAAILRRLSILLEKRGLAGDLDLAIETLARVLTSTEKEKTHAFLVLRLADLFRRRLRPEDIHAGIRLLEEAQEWVGTRYYLARVLIQLTFLIEARNYPDDLARAIDLLKDILQNPAIRHDAGIVCLRLAELLERRNTGDDLNQAVTLLGENSGSLKGTDHQKSSLRMISLLEKRGDHRDLERAIVILEGNDPLFPQPSSRDGMLMRLVSVLDRRGQPNDKALAAELLNQIHQAQKEDSDTVVCDYGSPTEDLSSSDIEENIFSPDEVPVPVSEIMMEADAYDE